MPPTRPPQYSFGDFTLRLPRMFPQGPSTPLGKTVAYPGATKDLLTLIDLDPGFKPHVLMIFGYLKDGFAKDNDYARLLAIITEGAKRQTRVQVGGETETSNPFAAPEMHQVLQERLLITSPRDEPDSDPSQRELASATLSSLSTGGPRLRLGVAPRDLDVTGLRNHALAAIYAVMTGERNDQIVHAERPSASNRGRKYHYHYLVDADLIYGFDFPYLETIFIDAKELYFRFDRPMNTEAIKELFEDQRTRFEVRPIADKPDHFAVYVEKQLLITFSPYNIAIAYPELVNTPRTLMRAITLATRAVEALHHDRLVSSSFQIVDMKEFIPVFHAMMGVKDYAPFGEVGRYALKNLPHLSNPEMNVFIETGHSQKNRAAAYRRHGNVDKVPPAIYRLVERAEFFQNPPHTKYVLIEDKRPQRFLIGFDVNLQVDALIERLPSLGKGLSLSESKTGTLRQRGGMPVTRKRREWHVMQDVEGGEPRCLMSFSLRTVNIPITEKDEDMELAFRILDHIHAEGLFWTGTHKAEKVAAGLTESEKAFLPIWNTLMGYFRRYVEYDYQQKGAAALLNRLKPVITPKPHEWFVEVMKGAPQQTQGGRLLHLYKTIYNLINPDWFGRYGPGDREEYAALMINIRQLESSTEKA